MHSKVDLACPLVVISLLSDDLDQIGIRLRGADKIDAKSRKVTVFKSELVPASVE